MRSYSYIAVRDRRTGKLYLDKADSLIRSFEVIEARSDRKDSLIKSFPDITDVTREKTKTIYDKSL